MQTINQILEKYWGFQSFRPKQAAIIQSVLDQKDTIALLPTGGGKSICFQIPALAQEGICIVISPLIALMKDQVSNALKRGISAQAIFSGMSRREIDIALDNCIYGRIKLLYVSPERLQTDLFKARLAQMNVNLLAIDEAHCISQWGYDFRPPYLQIADIRSLIPSIPILALTASATPKVQEDIADKLRLKQPFYFRSSFERENISFSVFKEENPIQKTLEILHSVGGSGIIYVKTRRRTKEIAHFLLKNHLSADFYHGGLDTNQRSAKQDNWIKDATRIMVCTNAFGMGIDKPDVRLVIHLDIPEHIEAYYQEAGRAGRDGKKAYAVLLYQQESITRLQEQIDIKYPSIDLIKQVYDGLGFYFQLANHSGLNNTFDFDLLEFCDRFNLPINLSHHALKLIELQGLIHLTDHLNIAPRVHFIASREAIYKVEVSNRQLEPLIKYLLRAYEGIGSNYVNIHEKDITKRLGLTLLQLRQQLEQLKQLELIAYEPVKNKPQLTYLVGRIPSNIFKIDHQVLKVRRELFKENINAIINYVEHQSVCRSVLILAYFGESNGIPCGKCDICLGRHNKTLSPQVHTEIESELKHTLETPKTLEELLKAIHHHDEQVIQVLRILIDNNMVQEKDQLFTWQTNN